MNADTAVILGYVKKANEPLLLTCIQALKEQTYKDFDIYIYDNSCLSDGLEIVKEKYPEVKIQKNTKNLGFAGGNNSVMREVLKDPNYKYVVLLNDDTKVSNVWLDSLIETAHQEGNIGAVTSKLIFYEPFVRLEFKTQTFIPKELGLNEDARTLGVKFFYKESKFLNSDYSKRFFRDGFNGIEGDYLWTKGDFVLDMPIGSKDTDNYILDLVIQGSEHLKDQTVDLKINDFTKTLNITTEKQTFSFEVPKSTVEKNKFDLIQNAGSGITAQFNGYDIGSINGEAEVDEGQYEQQREVEMICGGAVLFKAEALRKVGIFDEYFFVYYEDSDLSLRLKRAGYKLLYEPKAVLRHIHAGSSTEYSPLFSYNVWKNKPAFVVKNFGIRPSLYAIKEITFNCIKEIRTTLRQRFSNGYQNSRTKVILKSLAKFYVNLPLIILKKFNIVKSY